MISTDTIKKAIDLVVEAARPEKVILFGSYARGTAHEDSDIDLCVIEKDLKNRRFETVRLRRVLSPLRIPVDIIVHSAMTVNEWASVHGTLLHAIVHEGKVLYERPS